MDPTFRVAVVGAGPSGFYAAEALLRSGRRIAVDMFERLPAPHGLVRYGVAPDHPKLKLVTTVFDRVAAMPGFRFLGGVEVGKHVAIGELRGHYHAVVVATGAEEARALQIPGECLPGSHCANAFVGWYNGHPDFRGADFDLGAEVAVVVGHGNVALDVARILLKTPDELARTDIAAHASAALAASRIREVHVVGRSGPQRAKFTEKELAEFLDLADADLVAASEDLSAGDLDTEGVDDAEARRLLALIAGLRQRPSLKRRRCVLRFHLGPVAIQGEGRVERIVFARTNAPAHGPTAIDCGLVFSSIGRRTMPIDGVAYDGDRGVHANLAGRARDAARLYVCGWSKRGASGTIGTNRACSSETANAVISDLPEWASADIADNGPLIDRIAVRVGRIVDFAAWEEDRRGGGDPRRSGGETQGEIRHRRGDARGGRVN